MYLFVLMRGNLKDLFFQKIFLCINNYYLTSYIYGNLQFGIPFLRVQESWQMPQQKKELLIY